MSQEQSISDTARGERNIEGIGRFTSIKQHKFNCSQKPVSLILIVGVIAFKVSSYKLLVTFQKVSLYNYKLLSQKSKEYYITIY